MEGCGNAGRVEREFKGTVRNESPEKNRIKQRDTKWRNDDFMKEK